MNQPWFRWKGQHSYIDYGLWISKLPPIVRATERTKQVQIPGRTGSVTLTEGDDVYEPVVKKCVVTAKNSMDLQPILKWLRGSSELTFSNEAGMVYFARIASEVSFARISPDLCQATIVFDCQPLKGRTTAAYDTFTVTSSYTVSNPGNVASSPIWHITGTGEDCRVTVSSKEMVFKALEGTIDVDTENKLILQNGKIWEGTFEGAFRKIKTGSCLIAIYNGSMTVEPKWRWV